MELKPLLPHWTLESIKGKRKSKEYKQLVLRIRNEEADREKNSCPTEKLVVELSEIVEVEENNTPPPSEPASGLIPGPGSEIWDTSGDPVETEPLSYMLGETFIVGSIEYYLSDLNTNNTLRPPPNDEEIKLLDRALLISDSNQELAKELCHEYMLHVFGEDLARSPKGKKPRQAPKHPAQLS